ncbi:transketolase [Candidatus Peregrinibacteria bacterium]|nr:transketolase [Candidatus Peregrinibacteria bacterium]
MKIPKFGEKLTEEQLYFLETFTQSCRSSIIEMVGKAQSGHPGGSLSAIDYLATLYAFVISQSGQKVVVSNGHISPAVYSTLAELGYIPKKKVLNSFRKAGSIYEGHVTRLVPGVWYGTGPLGTGTSAATGFAINAKLNKSKEKVYLLMGDGEVQEGQVYEMANFASKYKLDNLIGFVDYNKVQLTSALDEIMPINIEGIFKAAGWEVFNVDAHDYQAVWDALSDAQSVKGKPVVLLGHSIMGKGVDILEPEGKAFKATWHGKSPSWEDCEKALEQLKLNENQINILDKFSEKIKWKPSKPKKVEQLKKLKIKTGKPNLYNADVVTDCRSAYGAALLDLAEKNPEIIALTADLSGSVKTAKLAEKFPSRHLECGIAEQHMMSTAGALSLDGRIPFASTFAAFASSRAKDQARVNDINHTNVKIVSTHAGLSVGEDGPTHQAIDDSGSFLGLFNTMHLEPADPNQADRMIRFIASHYGNFYMRMGRHKVPVITRSNGKPFYDQDYKYEYGKCDVLRRGKDITIVAIGSMVNVAVEVADLIKNKMSVEVVGASSIKKFDKTVFNSIKKTGKVVTMEDHNPFSGLANMLAAELTRQNIAVELFKDFAVEEYQLSGKAEELYKLAGLSAENVVKYLENLK